MLRKLLAEKRQAPQPQGRVAILLALTQVDLALGNFPEAEKEAQEAASQALAGEGPRSYSYAFALFLRGRAHLGAGNWTAAELDIRESLEAHERALGSNHPRIVPLLADLAELLGRRGKHAEALANLGRALEIHQAHLGSHHPDFAALQLAAAHQKRAMGEKEQASELYRRALLSATAIHQPSDPALGPFLNGNAAAAFDLGEFEEAEQFVRHAITIYESQPDLLHSGMADSYRSLATLLARQGDVTESRTMLERCLSVLQHFHGESHQSLLGPLIEYAGVLEKLGDAKRARQMTAKADAIAATLPEQRHTISVDVLRNFR